MVTFDGLPLHPLIVHAPVVLIPLVAVGLVLVLVRPSLRATLAPIVAVLAVGAAVAAVGAVWSGEELAVALRRGEELATHQSWGELARTFAIILALGAIAFAAADRFLPQRPAITRLLGVATTGVAIAAVGVVGVAGHEGATLSWEGRVSTETGGTSTDGGDDAVTESDAAGGGDEQPGPSAEPLPGVGVPGVDVVLGEWALVPSAEVARPGTITFRFRNLGTVPHALRIRTSGSGSDRLEWRSQTVAPGESGLLVADLTAGTYEIDCPVEDGEGEHDELGMEMLFRVQEDAAALDPLPEIAGERPADGSGSAADGGASAPSETTSSEVVEIRSFAYEPADIEVPMGTELAWVNRDPAPHTATGDGFDTGELGQDARGTVTFTETGTFEYLCTIHPAMRGRVTVVQP